MSKMRDHLISTGEFHANMSKCHKAMAAECEEDSPADVFHKAAAECHAQMAAKCLDAAKAESGDLEKADQLQPTKVSAVNPSPQPRAVYRDGQRIMPAAGAGEMPPNVPAIYQKIFAQESED